MLEKFNIKETILILSALVMLGNYFLARREGKKILKRIKKLEEKLDQK